MAAALIRRLRARAAAPGVTVGCRKGRGAPPPPGSRAIMEVAEEAAGRRHRSALLIFRSSESWTRSERDGVEGDGDMAGGSTPGRRAPSPL